MTTLRLVAIMSLLSLLTGCVSRTESHASIIQRALDRALPATFSGDAHVEHKNPYLDVTIDAGNLRRTEAGWQWDWLKYRRNGRISHGEIRLGQVPSHL